MNKYTYHSILKDEIYGFINLRKSQGLQCLCETAMRYLDTYLADKNVSEKNITPNIIDGWIAESFNNLNPNTVNNYASDYIQFAKYLNTLGINAYFPLLSGFRQSYVPYIFSKEEIGVIFDTADNIKSAINPEGELWFPMLLRLLYGCGLRLAEALSLTFSDVDLNGGVLFVKKAKGNKDRQLSETADSYRITPLLSTYLGHTDLSGTQKYLHMTAEVSENIHTNAAAYYEGLFPEVPR